MIEKVSIKPWCIACKNCESICPSTFKVNWKSMVINHNYKENIKKIIQARDMCPVKVIDVKLKEWVWEIDFNISWEIIQKNYLTPDTVELKIKSSQKLDFIPWQYVWLVMKDNLWNFTRSYSIADFKNDIITLNIKILKDWRWWKIIDKINVWEKIKFIEPSWHFILKDTKKEKVFIATWTWLAPMIAMINSLDKNIKKTVIFWVRFENDIYYKNILENFENTKVIITVSKPDQNYKWNIWRVDTYIEWIDKNSEFYICWNPEMVETVKKELKIKWVEKNDIVYESFVAAWKKSKFKDVFIEWNIWWLNYLNWWFIILWLLSPILLINFWKYYYWISWDIAWWSVVFIMIIRPLADIFPNILLFRKMVVLRKWLWVLSWMIIIWQMINSYHITNLNFWTTLYEYIKSYFNIWKWSWISIIPRITEITALLLVLTSNTFSQKILWISWKRVQKLAYVYFLTSWYYLYSFGKIEALYSIVVVLFLYFTAEIIKRKNPK